MQQLIPNALMREMAFKTIQIVAYHIQTSIGNTYKLVVKL